MKFTSQHTFAARLKESRRIMSEYPDRLPVICERSENNSSDIPKIDKIKYLAPLDLTISQFLHVIRNKIKLSAEKAIFLFVDGTIPPGSAFISQIYSQHKNSDGFLYFTYSGENVFG